MLLGLLVRGGASAAQTYPQYLKASDAIEAPNVRSAARQLAAMAVAATTL
ncbi:MAG TPA: hypothetical protein VGI58_12085 [Streptosporangiaceae bacterium]